eukprot:TRINITY_DN12251_c0_g1_i1.p1 TRINITY_DN12251_c0_g1~~TRINITY_DN12251_c0_g1_i1.p1  ORF type:complete len:268 (-),score=16.79 TRINITY_DN12251_c0_g1_i1:91-894(-)
MWRRASVGRVVSLVLAGFVLFAGIADGRPSRSKKSTGSRRRGRATREDEDDALFVTGSLAVFGCILLFGIIVLALCVYLDYNPTAGRLRCIMYSLIISATLLELGLCATDTLHWSVAIVVIISSLWGSLDAILRFPVFHDFDTIFTLKQIILIGIKILAFGLGISSKIWFYVLFMIEVLFFPLIYYVNLQLDDSERFRAVSEVVDDDILCRVGAFFTNTRDRRRDIMNCRRRVRSVIAKLALRSQMARQLLRCTDPASGRALSSRKV